MMGILDEMVVTRWIILAGNLLAAIVIVTAVSWFAGKWFGELMVPAVCALRALRCYGEKMKNVHYKDEFIRFFKLEYMNNAFLVGLLEHNLRLVFVYTTLLLLDMAVVIRVDGILVKVAFALPGVIAFGVCLVIYVRLVISGYRIMFQQIELADMMGERKKEEMIILTK